MEIDRAMIKPLPRWFRRASVVLTAIVIALIILVIGIQLGLWSERSTQSAQAIRAEFERKDAEIDKLKIIINDTQFALAVEEKKLEILLCESGIQHKDVWGDGGKSYGIAQFKFATFKELRKLAGRPELRWKNRDDQIWLLDWALRHGYGKYWTCYQKGGPL
jgi:hypothetical protein